MISEPLIVAFDTVALVGFTAAIVLTMWSPTIQVGTQGRLVMRFLALAFLVYAFVSASNILEHAGITDALDTYEDYAETLFFPLLTYAFHTANVNERMLEVERSRRRVSEEHRLLAAIIDSSPAGVFVVSPD